MKLFFLIVLLLGIVLGVWTVTRPDESPTDKVTEEPAISGQKKSPRSRIRSSQQRHLETATTHNAEDSDEISENGADGPSLRAHETGVSDEPKASEEEAAQETSQKGLETDPLKILESFEIEEEPHAEVEKMKSIVTNPALAKQINGTYEGPLYWIQNKNESHFYLKIDGRITSDQKFQGSFELRITDKQGNVQTEPNSYGDIGQRIKVKEGAQTEIFLTPEGPSQNKIIQLIFTRQGDYSRAIGNYYFNFNDSGAPLKRVGAIFLEKKL